VSQNSFVFKLADRQIDRGTTTPHYSYNYTTTSDTATATTTTTPTTTSITTTTFSTTLQQHYSYIYSITTSTASTTLQLQLHYEYNYNYNYITSTATNSYNYIALRYATLHPEVVGEVATATTPKFTTTFGPSVDSLCHPFITTTHLSYSLLSLRLPPQPCAVLLVDAYVRIYCVHIHIHIVKLVPGPVPILSSS
jgi:hypothetical protein